MGIDTVGFVLTEDKDFFRVIDKIGDAITKYTLFAPTFEISPYTNFAVSHFKVIDTNSGLPFYQKPVLEKRTLSVHFGCDGDYSHVATGAKIIWNLGASGKAPEIIRAICEVMKEFGPVYFTANDADDNWEVI